MAPSKPVLNNANSTSTSLDRNHAHDAYEDFWASLEHPFGEDTAKVSPNQPQPVPGVAYDEFLDRDA